MSRYKFSSPEQPLYIRLPLRLYEFAASLSMAVVLIFSRGDAGDSPLSSRRRTAPQSCSFMFTNRGGSLSWYSCWRSTLLHGGNSLSLETPSNRLCDYAHRFAHAAAGFVYRLHEDQCAVGCLKGRWENGRSITRSIWNSAYSEPTRPHRSRPMRSERINIRFDPGLFNWQDWSGSIRLQSARRREYRGDKLLPVEVVPSV